MGSKMCIRDSIPRDRHAHYFAILGIIAVVFTGGAALAVIGGALAGFVIGEMTVGTMPSIKAYDQDEVFDQNSRPVNLMITDKSYYGIT